MVELKKIKIKKQLYKFEVRKKFQYVKRFKIKEKRPIDTIRETFKTMFRRKPEEKKLGRGGLGKAVPKSNKTILFGSIGLALFILFIAFMYFYIEGAKSAVDETIVILTRPELNLTITDSGIVTAGDKKDDLSIAYLRYNYQVNSADTINVSLQTYDQVIPSEVFILRSRRDEAQTTTYPIFKSVLKKELGKKGISVNEMDLQQVETLPKGAFLIVPSGRIPQELLGIDSNIDINQLIERGVVVIYIGLPLDKMINKDGYITSTPPQILSTLGYEFEEGVNLISTPGFNLNQAYYEARGIGVVEKATQKIYGSISVVKRENGAIVFVPQTLDTGWKTKGQKDPQKAAMDITKIVLEMPWVGDASSKATYTFKAENQTMTKTLDFFSNSFKGNQKYMRVDFTVTDPNGNSVGKVNILKIKKKEKGDLYIEGGFSVVSSEITSQPVRLIADLKEDKPATKILYLKTYKDGKPVGERMVIAQTPVNLQTDHFFDKPISLDTGIYLAKIEDDEGKIYAQGVMKVVFADVIKLRDIEDRKIFSFEFQKEGVPIALRDVAVTVLSSGGKNYGTYTYTDVSKISVDVSEKVLGSDKLPFGDYVFKFKIGEIEKEVPYSYTRSEVIFEKPEFILVAAFSILIVFVGVFFARKEDVSYQLDIPDFPPIAKTKIPVRKEILLAIFGQVNEYYKWTYTPLTIAEIKSGFKKLLHEGRPIYVTDYNIEYLMDKMVKAGLVKTYLEYYTPVNWEKETGKTSYYLCMFRKLRDVFVNNAVPFSLLSEEKNCDTKINLMGQDMFVFVYDNKGDLSKLIENQIKSSKAGISIVVFNTEDQKQDFTDTLYSPSSAATIVKLEVETNSILLETTKEFEAMIQEMKG